MGNSKQASLLTEVHRDHLHAWNAIKKKRFLNTQRLIKVATKAHTVSKKRKQTSKVKVHFFSLDTRWINIYSSVAVRKCIGFVLFVLLRQSKTSPWWQQLKVVTENMTEEALGSCKEYKCADKCVISSVSGPRLLQEHIRKQYYP